METEFLIPISMFIGMTIVLVFLIWFRARSRSEVQQTIRSALDKGQELTPDLIASLGHPKPAKDKDMRLGVIWIAVAIGLMALGFGIPDNDEAPKVLMGVACFPLAIGIGYLILHKFTDRS